MCCFFGGIWGDIVSEEREEPVLSASLQLVVVDEVEVVEEEESIGLIGAVVGTVAWVFVVGTVAGANCRVDVGDSVRCC